MRIFKNQKPSLRFLVASFRGSALLATVLVCGVMTVVMASYLAMLKSQHFTVARQQAWEQAIVVAEAGVEEALAHLTDDSTTSGLGSSLGVPNKWTNTDAPAKINFAKSSGLTNSYYSVVINAADRQHPIITSTGYVAGPVGSPLLQRTVQVKTAPSVATIPPGAFVVLTTIDLSGSTISTDSFNSTNLTLFPGGLYNAANAQDHGDITTLSTNAGDLNAGNAQIRGTVHTGKGGLPIKQTGSGSIGDANFVNGGSTGTEAGHALDDATGVFPDAALPVTGGIPYINKTTADNQTIGGITYKYVFTDVNAWKIGNLDGNVLVNGSNVRLWVTNSVGSGVNYITIPAGKKLSLFMGAANCDLGGCAIINPSGLAKNFLYYGLPSNTSLKLNGNAAMTATIYAPEADFTLDGSGNTSTNDFTGVAVVKSAQFRGRFNFHFDEGVAVNLLFRYTPTSWEELYVNTP